MLFAVRSDDIASFEMSELETLYLLAHQMLSVAGRNGVLWDLKLITEYIAELGLTVKAMDQNQVQVQIAHVYALVEMFDNSPFDGTTVVTTFTPVGAEEHLSERDKLLRLAWFMALMHESGDPVDSSAEEEVTFSQF
jgi:hypothetical protein